MHKKQQFLSRAFSVFSASYVEVPAQRIVLIVCVYSGSPKDFCLQPCSANLCLRVYRLPSPFSFPTNSTINTPTKDIYIYKCHEK